MNHDEIDHDLQALPRVSAGNAAETRAKAHALLSGARGKPSWKQWLDRAEPVFWIAASTLYLLWAASASFAIHQ